ncbi:MAG: ATP-binding protein [Bosea sp. (in: a-proteobacteria)]
MASWGFYGRREEIAEIEKIIGRGQFFFASISGRRRIGKTSLIQEVLRRKNDRALYVQIPDSDERGIIQVFEDSVEDRYEDQDLAREICKSFGDIADVLEVMWGSDVITIIDEFQYFYRSSLSEFQSRLQAVVDRVRGQKLSTGGLFALGSIHTEMTAILEDKDAPLFNRVTDRISLKHWDAETLFEMFRAHDIHSPSQRLFFWSIFEGVPKFYRDCFDQRVLVPFANEEQDRRFVLRRMFFEGSSPLKDEADNWFLRELRGRYDSVLTLLARSGPIGHGALKAEYGRTGEGGEKQLGGYLQALIEKYAMVARIKPIFSGNKQRNARYVITDNFLQAWLTSLLRNVRLARIRPMDEAVAKADVSLMVNEGLAFEKFVKQVIEECSRKGVGDFSLTEIVAGYWDKPETNSDEQKSIEIDLIAINETDRIVRFGSCKRSESKHTSEALAKFERHIARFLQTGVGKRFHGWTHEKALYSPEFTIVSKIKHSQNGYIAVDMLDFEKWLFRP